MKKHFLLFWIGLLGACYKPSIYDPQSNNPNLLVIEPRYLEIPANGTFVDTLVVTIPLNSDPGKRSVTLSATNGTFVNSDSGKITLNIDNTNPDYPNKRVEFVLFKSALESGIATIVGTLLTNTSSVPIKMITDPATKIHVEADRFFISNGQEAIITATLSMPESGNGQPTTGQRVIFLAAIDSLGLKTKGYFRAIKDRTDESQRASAIYACDTTYKGHIYIIGKTIRGNKDTVSSKFLLFKN